MADETEPPPTDQQHSHLLASLARSSDHLYVFDRSGRYLYASPAGAAALGLTPVDMVGRRWSDLGLPAEVMERFDGLRESVLESGRPVKARTLYPGNGQVHDLELWLLPINGGDARPETVICVARERNPGGPAAIEDPDACHWWPGEPLPMLVCYVDGARRYRYNSVAYSDWFGRSPREIQGSCLWDVLGEAAYERIRPHVESALAGIPAHFEQVLPYQDAGTRTVRVHYLPDRAPNGDVCGFFALVSDLTPDAEVTGQRPGLIGPDMLGSRERLATIGEMATEILHEMSQPLTSIGLFSETGVRMLAGSAGPDQALEVLEEIRRQADRARGMMERLRRFVRSARASEAPVEINHLVRTAVGFAAPEIEAREVALELRLRSGLCIVSAERVLLEHLMLHLIRGALVAMAGRAPGQRRLLVRTRATEMGVAVAVADTGEGMDGERCLRLMTPFAGPSPAPEALWLAVSRAIVGSLGGRLRIRSLPGRGTVVRFTLPASCEA